MKTNLTYKNYDTCIFICLKKNEILSLVYTEIMSVFQQNGIEITVLVKIEHDSSEYLLDFVKNNPLINWRFLTYLDGQFNEAFSKAVSLSPKSYYYLSLEKLINQDHFNRLKYLKGKSQKSVIQKNIDGKTQSLFCIAKHLDLRLVSFNSLAQAIENIEYRLHPSQKVSIILPGVKIKSPYFKKELATTEEIVETVSDKILFYPQVVYDYLNKSNGRYFCEKVLTRFSSYVFSEHLDYQSFKVIALVQTFNEIENINSLLIHLNQFCDGIILLDDGSTDGTYEEAQHEKLLLKVKKNRVKFNDLDNRNTLLDLVSFFNHEWAFFIDADERFDLRYSDLYKHIENSINHVFAFHLINLWDSEINYRIDLEDSNNLSKDGILVRWRMFRNIGRCQIISDQSLHFPTVPYFTNMIKIPVLIKHFGMLNRQLRLDKYKFYQNQDQNFEGHKKRNYDPLNSETKPLVRPVDSIRLLDLL